MRVEDRDAIVQAFIIGVTWVLVTALGLYFND